MHIPAITNSLDFYSVLVNAMPGNHLVLLPDAPVFTIAAVSDDYLAALSFQREFLVGRGIFDVFFRNTYNDVAAEQLRQSLPQVIETKQTHLMSDQRHGWPNDKTGETQWRTWRPVNKPVVGPDNEVSCIIHTIEDITHAVQLVEIAEANRYLQSIINTFKEPLQVLEPVVVDGQIIDFRFKLTNQAYASYANATPSELQGKRVSEVFPGYIETVSFTNPVETYTTGQTLTFEIHYDKDGLDLYNLMSTSKLDEEVIIHFTDFTRLRQLQFQLESKIEELKHSNDNLQRFAYVASHDLQEPLRKIQQFGDLLQSRYGPSIGEGVQYLERMQQAASRMSMLIKDLLAFSHISTGQVASQPVSLAKVVNQALDNLSLVIEESKPQIEVDNLPTVLGDDLQLMQLFQNLLSNALKFQRNTNSGETVKPEVTIRSNRLQRSELPASLQPARAADVYHRIEISDNGIGFDAKYADRIFQVFQRLHNKQEYAGTGVGLAIVQKVVTNHGGAITATGQVGQGATFSVYLPAYE
jgi:signal transduction histidine kinase